MTKGKLYEELVNEATERDGYSRGFTDLIDDIKKDFDTVPEGSPFSPSDMMGGWMDHPEDFASGARALKQWYKKWFGDSD